MWTVLWAGDHESRSLREERRYWMVWVCVEIFLYIHISSGACIRYPILRAVSISFTTESFKIVWYFVYICFEVHFKIGLQPDGCKQLMRVSFDFSVEY